MLIVGCWVSGVGGHAILRAWVRLRIEVGDLHFSARWEAAAPQTIEAIRRMLPIDSKLIHCRWSGESTWIPYGDFRPGIDYENHTSHPAPGHARDVPGRHQRVRDLLPVRRLHDVVEGRPAGGQPLRLDRRPTTAGRTDCARSVAAPSGRAPRRSGSPRSTADGSRRAMTDLLIRGGTVVTAGGSRRADVAVDGGVITAIEPDLGGPAARRGRGDRCDRDAGPPRRRRRPHAHPGRVDAEPDRFFQDSVAAAYGGTTSFLSFNNPGTGSSPAGRAIAADRAGRMARRDGRGQRDRLRPLARGLRPRRRPAGRASRHDRCRRRDLEGVHGLRLPPRRSGAVRCDAGHGRARRDAPGPLRGSGAARRRQSRPRLQRGDTLPRYHATSRPPYVEAVATARALAFARATDSPVHVVHLSSAAALDEVRRAKAAGVRVIGRDLPALPGADRRGVRRARPGPLRVLRHLAAAAVRRRSRRAVGGTGRRVARPRRHRPRPRSRRRREGRGRLGRVLRPDQQRRAGHRDAAGARLQRRRRPRPDHASSGWSSSCRRRRRPGSASPSKGALEVGRDADIVVFDPARARTLRATDLHHTSDYTPYEGLEVSGAVRDVFVRGDRRHPRRRLRRPPRRRPVHRARPDRRLMHGRRCISRVAVALSAGDASDRVADAATVSAWPVTGRPIAPPSRSRTEARRHHPPDTGVVRSRVLMHMARIAAGVCSVQVMPSPQGRMRRLRIEAIHRRDERARSGEKRKARAARPVSRRADRPICVDAATPARGRAATSAIAMSDVA